MRDIMAGDQASDPTEQVLVLLLLAAPAIAMHPQCTVCGRQHCAQTAGALCNEVQLAIEYMADYEKTLTLQTSAYCFADYAL